MEGKYKTWHRPEDGGKLKTECVYKDGELKSEYKRWYKNGQLWLNVCTKKASTPSIRRWYENGQLNEECMYKDDRCKLRYET